MTKVKINPGICGFITSAQASSDDEMTVKLNVKSGCPSVKKMMEELGDTFDAFEVCLQKPGEGPFYEYAKENFPVHVSCPILPGIIKCVEVECNLALKGDASITFEE
ncbi:MAG: DUF6951 family protein [Ruminococcus sp.]|jgi:hypothetical protein